MPLTTDEPPPPGSVYIDILREHGRPLEPIPTGVTPRLARLPGIRAVLFDIYGTLFISGSGEVGTAGETACEAALAGALEAVGIRPLVPLEQGVGCLVETIRAFHAQSRERGIDYPEVDIVEVWHTVLTELKRRGTIELPECPVVDPRRLALEYEARTNPVWPMPCVKACLNDLRRAGLVLGIVSNAQFYTRELFGALLGGSAESCGFDRQLQYYSYQHGRAKPAPELFRLAAEALSVRGISPSEVLYVGNDMLNDILPAVRLGFAAALFAGDARSLRLRRDDARVVDIGPQLVLTRLSQIRECIIV